MMLFFHQGESDPSIRKKKKKTCLDFGLTWSCRIKANKNAEMYINKCRKAFIGVSRLLIALLQKI